MKQNYTFLKCQLVLLLTASVTQAQTQINQSFSPPWSIALNGWANVNNSTPIGTSTWGQGNSVIFPAASGAANAYLGILYLTASQTASANISNFLITPTVSLSNGQIFQFATRTGVGSLYPDRLQLRMSTQGSSTLVGTGANSVGDFTNLLLDINPLYSASNSSVVSNGTVNGYPDTWTVYTTTLTGITGTVTGRFAFRYYVTNAGLNATNGNYIGIDDVFYSAPCTQPTVSVVQSSSITCINSPVTFSATGCSTYTWTSPSASTTINPFVFAAGNTTGNVTFTVSGKDISGCISNPLLITQQISDCTSISSLLNAENQTVFPNPFNNAINLENFEGTAQLYNSQGTLLTTVSVTNSSIIETGTLSGGIYSIKLTDAKNGKVTTIKLLKLGY